MKRFFHAAVTVVCCFAPRPPTANAIFNYVVGEANADAYSNTNNGGKRSF